MFVIVRILFVAMGRDEVACQTSSSGDVVLEVALQDMQLCGSCSGLSAIDICTNLKCTLMLLATGILQLAFAS